MLMTKSYIWKKKKSESGGGVARCCGWPGFSWFAAEPTIDKQRDDYIGYQRDVYMNLWCCSLSFFFFYVQYFSYTIIKWNRCILKAQQIQNIIKEYDNITQNNTNKWWYFDILYLSWDLQATHETSWLFLLFSSLLLLLLLVPLLM